MKFEFTGLEILEAEQIKEDTKVVFEAFFKEVKE